MGPCDDAETQELTSALEDLLDREAHGPPCDMSTWQQKAGTVEQRMHRPPTLGIGQSWFIGTTHGGTKGAFGRIVVTQSRTRGLHLDGPLVKQGANLLLACQLVARLLDAYQLSDEQLFRLSAVQNRTLRVILSLAIGHRPDDAVEQNSLVLSACVALASWILGRAPRSDVVCSADVQEQTGLLKQVKGVQTKADHLQREWPHIKELLLARECDTSGPVAAESPRIARHETVVEALDFAFPTGLGRQRPPWPGMGTYAAEDESLFAGRREEEEHALKVLERGGRMVVIHGASGMGKSSLVRAGIQPKLLRKLRDPVVVNVRFGPEVSPREAWNMAALRLQKLGVEWSALAAERRSARRGRLTAPVVVLLDQLEEVQEESEEFFQELCLRIARLVRMGAYVLATLPDAEALRGSPSMRSLRDEELLVPLLLAPLDASGVRAVVTVPLRSGALSLDDSFINLMVNRYTGGQPALLNMTLQALWRARGTSLQPFNLALLKEVDDGAGPIRQLDKWANQATIKAVEKLGRASPPYSVEEKTDVLLALLVDFSDDRGALTRGFRTRDELALRLGLPRAHVDAICEVLAGYRLLEIQGETVLLGHKLLLKLWDRLTAARKRWERALRLGSELAQDIANNRFWVDRPGDCGFLRKPGAIPFLLTDREKNFLARSEWRRIWPRVAMVVIGGLLIVVITGFGVRESTVRDLTRARDLRVQSERLRDEDDIRSAQNLLEAYALHKDSPELPATALAWAQRKLRFTLPHCTGRPSWSPDGGWLAVPYATALDVWAINDGQPAPLVRLWFGTRWWVVDATFSPTGRWLLARYQDDKIPLWLWSTGRSPADWTRHNDKLPISMQIPGSVGCWHPTEDCLLSAGVAVPENGGHREIVASHICLDAPDSRVATWRFEVQAGNAPIAVAMSAARGAVLDSGSGRLWTFDPRIDSRALEQSARTSPRPEDLPRAIAFDNAGRLLVASKTGYVHRLDDHGGTPKLLATGAPGRETVSLELFERLAPSPWSAEPLAPRDAVVVNGSNSVTITEISGSTTREFHYPDTGLEGTGVRSDLRMMAYKPLNKPGVRLVSRDSSMARPFAPALSALAATGDAEPVRDIAFDPIQRRVAVATSQDVVITDEHRKATSVTQVYPGIISQLAWSPDGQALAVVQHNADGRAILSKLGFDPKGAPSATARFVPGNGISEVSWACPIGWGEGGILTMGAGLHRIDSKNAVTQLNSDSRSFSPRSFVGAWNAQASKVSGVERSGEDSYNRLWTWTGPLWSTRSVAVDPGVVGGQIMHPCYSAALDPAGKRIAIRSGSREIRVLDTESGQELWKSNPLQEEPTEIQWDTLANGDSLIAVGGIQVITIIGESNGSFASMVEVPVAWQVRALAHSVRLRWNPLAPGHLVAYVPEVRGAVMEVEVRGMKSVLKEAAEHARWSMDRWMGHTVQ